MIRESAVHEADTGIIDMSGVWIYFVTLKLWLWYQGGKFYDSPAQVPQPDRRPAYDPGKTLSKLKG